MKTTRLVAAGVGLSLTLATTVFLAPAAQAAGPRPAFQLPFPCGQAWNGDNDNSSAHRAYEIDFNRGGSPGADKGDTVTAAAAGKVITSAHQGSLNGYGNLIVIDHGGGWRTYYAHLDVRSVGVGAQVSRGQKIGTVGNTSRPGNNISPHLHYEVRTTDTSYPANIQPAYFNGARFGYPNQTLTSRNCGSTANPHDGAEVCGAGYSVIDTASLGAAGSVQLLYNAGNSTNCVVTLKGQSIGTASAVSAYLEVEGEARTTDSGNFEYYAGPVRKAAEKKCVKWGGAVGATAYNSPFEHCG